MTQVKLSVQECLPAGRFTPGAENTPVALVGEGRVNGEARILVFGALHFDSHKVRSVEPHARMSRRGQAADGGCLGRRGRFGICRYYDTKVSSPDWDHAGRPPPLSSPKPHTEV